MTSASIQFERDGFVVLRSFLSDHDFQELRTELRRYIDTVVPGLPETDAFYVDRTRPETLKQLQHMDGDPYFRGYVDHPRWRGVAEDLLGESVKASGCEWFNKPPDSQQPTPPHQDNHYFNWSPANVLTMWLALEDIDQRTGCLRYVPGSHRAGRRPHHASRVLGFSQTISDYGQTDRAAELPVELRANDLVVHHGWTIHSADSNRSSARHRPAFAIVYHGVSCELDEEGKQTYLRALQAQHDSLGIRPND